MNLRKKKQEKNVGVIELILIEVKPVQSNTEGMLEQTNHCH